MHKSCRSGPTARLGSITNMASGTLRQVVDGIEYDLPNVPRYGAEGVGTAATADGVHVDVNGGAGVLLSADEARRLAEYLLEAAEWAEAVGGG